MIFPELETINKWKKEAHSQNKTLVLLCGGFSASGKDTRCRTFNLKKIITTTTRLIRNGEIDGRDYYFISLDNFKNGIEKNEFLEYSQYADNYYGTSKQEFLKCWENKQDCYAILDISGIINVENSLLKEYSDKFLIKKIYYCITKETFIERISNRDKQILSDIYLEKRWNQNVSEWNKLIKNRHLFNLILNVNEKVK